MFFFLLFFSLKFYFPISAAACVCLLSAATLLFFKISSSSSSSSSFFFFQASNNIGLVVGFVTTNIIISFFCTLKFIKFLFSLFHIHLLPCLVCTNSIKNNILLSLFIFCSRYDQCKFMFLVVCCLV